VRVQGPDPPQARRRARRARPGGDGVAGAPAPADGGQPRRDVADGKPAKTLVKPEVKGPPPITDKAASDDLAFALKYVDDFYEGVRDVLELKDKVRENAIRAYTDFGKLKDPPTILDAVLGSLVDSALGLIPGGSIIKAGLTAGIFALDMRALKKDLDVMPIPGVSAADEKKKGATEKHKERAGKIYDRGKTAVDAGGAAIKAGSRMP
jgi:hypothetical protein